MSAPMTYFSNRQSANAIFPNAHNFTVCNSTFNAYEGDINYILPNDEEKKLQEWLSAPNSSINYTTALNKRTPGTGVWIFDHPIYNAWRGEHGILWIQGKAGSGKTVLLSTIIENLSRNSSSQVFYHYFDAQPKAQPSNLNLENTLKTMVDDFVQKNHEICIVIDALDECTNQSLVSELIESISDHIWVVITSRNQPKYAETTGSRVISLDNNFKLNQDIDLYLEARLGTLAFRHNLHAEIKDALEEKVNGVFRWVDCQLNVLEQCATPKLVRKALQTLPPDLEQTYIQAVQRCKRSPNSAQAHHILMWLLHAFEPITNSQASAIVLVDLEEQMVEQDGQLNPQLDKIIDTTLVSVDSDGYLQFSHASVKEFLIQSHNVVQTMDLFEWKKNIMHESVFLLEDYSNKYWVKHIQFIEENHSGPTTTLRDLSKQILEDQSLMQSAADLIEGGSTDMVNVCGCSLGTPLSAAAVAGNKKMLEFLMSKGAKIDFQYGSALQSVAYHTGNISISKWLLDNGANVNVQVGQFGNALQASVWGHHKSTIKLLIEYGANINATGGPYGSALQAAGIMGKEEIVQLLLDYGADVHAHYGQLDTALQAAACCGNAKIIELLLKHGANVNAQGGKYGNALKAAVYHGKENIVHLLMKYGADINAQGGEYGNTLQTAVLSWNVEEKVIQMLINYGANVNSQDGKYGNALQAAAYYGKKNIVQLLLDHGAHVDAQGGEYGNALQAAAYGGSEHIVQLLLDYGADVNIQGGRYGSALQGAAFNGNESILRMLLRYGADIDAQCGGLGSVLRTAIFLGKENILQLLLDYGANVNAQCGDCLRTAAFLRKKGIVQLLLNNGADVNIRNHASYTVLRTAAYLGHEEIVKVLLDNGADAQDALQTAQAVQKTNVGFQRRSIVQLLLDYGI
ncbi:MAG: ankyrin repeat-containing domain protein [Lentinula lateritia]|nr:MAG: ankyrin repeat-containing domain protein [Lentinula lateritia]